MSSIYYCPATQFKQRLVAEMRAHGSTEAICIELQLSPDMYYKLKKGTRNVPSHILDKLDMYKVCDRNIILGYCKLDSDIDWSLLWKE